MTSPDFISFVEDMDRCWMQGRFQELDRFLASDIVIVAPGGGARIEGISPAIESYRQFISTSEVHRYVTSGHVVTHRGDAAVIEYGWQMTWSSGAVNHDDQGREVLVLARRAGSWQVVWRTQIPVTT